MNTLPVYQQIARDIANRIATKDLKEGDKISGRSILASEYKVSPETIRRAINILVEAGCVEVSHSYGVLILSANKALEYLKNEGSLNDVMELRAQLDELRLQRTQIDLQINQIIDSLVDLNTRFNYSDPMRRFEFAVHDNSKIVNKTIKEIGFYQKTGMTIIGVRKSNGFTISPGPDFYLETGDTLVIIGDIERLKDVEVLIN